eukprot:6398639-Amphidinium_carterae.1
MPHTCSCILALRLRGFLSFPKREKKKIQQHARRAGTVEYATLQVQQATTQLIPLIMLALFQEQLMSCGGLEQRLLEHFVMHLSYLKSQSQQ